MSKIVFRNNNTKAIKNILKQIGKDDYIIALKENGLIEQPPTSMSGFYLEFDVDSRDIDIWHQYGGGYRFKIISALGYWEIPNEGWEMVWEVNRQKLLK